MMTKKLLIICSLLVLQNITFGQVIDGLADEAEIKKECQLIVDDFMNGKITVAFDKLRVLWILPENEIDYLEKQSVKQFNLVEDRFGEPIGNKFVKEELIEDIAYRVTYVLKYEKHGIRIQFMFYNGKEGQWYLNSFKWDDGLSKLFED